MERRKEAFKDKLYITISRGQQVRVRDFLLEAIDVIYRYNLSLVISLLLLYPFVYCLFVCRCAPRACRVCRCL